MDTGIGNRNLYSACRLTSHFLYTHNHRYSGGGTGFVAQLPGKRMALVTNRRVVDQVWLDDAKDGTILERLDAGIWRKPTTKQQLSLSPQAVVYHPDDTIDTAPALIGPSTITAASLLRCWPPRMDVVDKAMTAVARDDQSGHTGDRRRSTQPAARSV